MNYLAHLYLADANPESLIGSLMGDFIKGPVDSRLPPTLSQGIIIHRKIDAFTDRHPLVITSRRRIKVAFRHYRGVLVDIFYDHFLARNWGHYSPLPLSCFCGNVYSIFRDHYRSLPTVMQHSVSYMIDKDLLASYANLAGVAHALRGIETRLRRPYPLRSAMLDLRQNYRALESDFKGFFPQLVAYVTMLKSAAATVALSANTTNHGVT